MGNLSLNGALQRLCEWTGKVDSEALQVLRDHWEEALPILIGEVEGAEPLDLEGGDMAPPLFYAALFLSAEKEEQQMLEPLLTLCCEEEFTLFFGDLPPITLGKILAACSGGKSDRLIGFFIDKPNSGLARFAIYWGLEHLALSGQWDRTAYQAWYTKTLEDLSRKTPDYFHLILLVRSFAFIPEVAKKMTDSFLESDEGNKEHKELFELLLKTSSKNQELLGNELEVSLLGSADDEMKLFFDAVAEEQAFDEVSDLLDDPTQVLEILEEDEADSEYELIESPPVRRNALCPCGSGKKFKKCCINQDSVRVPRFLLTWKGNLVKDKDLFAHQLMRAAFLHHDKRNYTESLVAGIALYTFLEEKVHSGITQPEQIEQQELFVGWEPVSVWMLLFLTDSVTLLLEGNSTGLLSESVIYWILKQFPEISLDLRKKIFLTRALIFSWTDLHYDQALADLRQVLEWDPQDTLAAIILAEHYQNHPSKPDFEAARQVLQARLERDFEKQSDREIIQQKLDILDEPADV